MTSACFLKDGDVYYGHAKLLPDSRQWFVYLVKDNVWLANIGEFDHVDQGWRACEKYLGIGDTRQV